MSSSPNEWSCLFAAWLVTIFGSVYLVFPASILPRMMETLDRGPAVAIWVVSGAFGSWAILNFFIGLAIDRFGDRTVVFLSVVALFVAGLWGWRAGLNQAFWWLVCSRVLGGVGVAGVWTAGANIVGEVFAEERQGLALGLFTTSAPAGTTIAQFSGPLHEHPGDGEGFRRPRAHRCGYGLD